MNREERELRIHRILVALDASPHSLAALEAAAELARRFRAELSGLYVEDVNLLRLSELPFAEELSLFSTARRRLDRKEINRQLRAHRVRVRRLISRAGEGAEVRWTFRVSRGRVAPEVLQAASEADMLVLGKMGWSPFTRRRIGSTARAALAAADRMTLFTEEGARVRPPVIVVYDGSPLAQRALATASAIVRRLESAHRLTVLILSTDSEAVSQVKAQADGWLQEQPLDVRYRLLTESTVPKLAQIIWSEEGGALVLPAKSAVLHDDAIVALLRRVRLPVLLVR